MPLEKYQKNTHIGKDIKRKNIFIIDILEFIDSPLCLQKSTKMNKLIKNFKFHISKGWGTIY